MSTFYKNGKTYMYCPQCGAEMEEKARFCMHCGYINYDNKDNNFLKRFARKIKKSRFNIRKEQSVDDFSKGSKVTLSNYKKGDKEIKKTGLEIRYTLFKNLMRLIVLIVVIVGIYYGYMFIRDKQQKYIVDAEKIVKYVKNNVHTCGKIYYFKFDENLNLDVESPYTKKGYSGYVLVINENGVKRYYISMYDGTFGFKESRVEDLQYYNVLPLLGGAKINDVTQTKC